MADADTRRALESLFKRLLAQGTILQPFPLDEVLVMIIALAEKPLSADQIAARLLVASPSYASQLASVKLLVPNAFEHRVRHHVLQSLRKYDLPIEVLGIGGESVQFKVTLAGALCAFRHELLPMPYLHVSNKDTSRLSRIFELPAEIRNLIYQAVLSFPGCGIRAHEEHMWDELRPSDRHKYVGFQVFDRSQSYPSEYRPGWNSTSSYTTLPRDNVLALLSVSKQIHGESMGIFYACNHFVFNSINELHSLLIKLPKVRLESIRHIAFTYDPNHHHAVARSALCKLSKLVGLKTVTMEIHERYWTRKRKRDGTRKHPEAAKFYGLSALARMDNLESLIICGQCVETAAYLKKTMKPKDKSFKFIVEGKEMAMG